MSRMYARVDAELSYPPPTSLVDDVTPFDRFFVRDHLSRIPEVDPDDWRLEVAGLVNAPRVVRFAELLTMPTTEVMATLECAGNGNLRRGMKTAVGNAVWTGVPLGVVLEQAGLHDDVDAVVAIGGDAGVDPDQPDGPGTYERAIPLSKALDPDTLLVHTMNGSRLTIAHGAPVRLVVPGHYGMDSVKWLTSLQAIRGQFDGFYTAHRYRERKTVEGLHTGRFIRDVRVKSLVTLPSDGDELSPGPQKIRGLAWAGARAVERVDVSTNGGRTWRAAVFGPPLGRYAWRQWSLSWEPSGGQAEIVARATDETGETQPLHPIPGQSYGANWVHRIRVGIGQPPDVTAAELEEASEPDGDSPAR